MNAALEDLITAELATASGLARSGASARIFFAHQRMPALEGAQAAIFLSLREVNDVAPATPSETQRNAPTPSAGAEILIGTLAEVEFSYRVELFSRELSGSSSAYSLLDAVVRRLKLEGVTTRLHRNGLVLVEQGELTSIPAVLETEYESRAVVELRFRAIQRVEEATTYIETIGVTGTLAGTTP